MILQILGCGTSTGVPLPGCTCRVCTSGKLQNERLRTSGLIRLDSGRNILIDASTDLRQQALKWKVSRVDALLVTHPHADHILGIDDLRCFNFVQRASIPCYGNRSTLDRIRRTFAYIFEPDPDYQGGGLPQVTLQEIQDEIPFTAAGASIQPFPLEHGGITVLGYRIGELAYATDCKRIPENSRKILKGVKVLVLDGLRYEAHRTHMTIDEAVSVAAELGIRRTVLTHMTHNVDFDEVSARLPRQVELAYDGLEIEFS